MSGHVIRLPKRCEANAFETGQGQPTKMAISTYWSMLVAKHEYAELKEGIWLEPALALLRRKTKGCVD